MVGEVYLPPEVIMEILSRVKVKSLLVLKSVCKLWRSIIEDQRFIQMHLCRTKDTCVLTQSLYEDGDNYKDFYLLPLNGLLLDIHKTASKFRLRNPAIKTKIDLPDPHHKPYTIWFFHLKISDNYKVVFVYGKEGCRFGGCQVLSLGIDLAWRNLETEGLHHLKGRQLNVSYLVLTDVATYILLCDAAATTTERDIVCMEMETEGFQIVTAPEALFAGWDGVRAIKWEDKMSLYKNVGRDQLHVWVLEDYKTRKWADNKIVISLSFLSKHANISDTFYPWRVKEGCLYIKANGTDICYNVKSGTDCIVDVPDMGGKVSKVKFTLVNPFRSSPLNTYNL